MNFDAGALTRGISLVSTFGFLLALSREGSFLFFLGAGPSYVMSVSDIVRASVLNVLPAIPMILFGLWLGDQSSSSPGKTVREKAIRFADKAPYYLLIGTFLLSSIMFIFWGMNPSNGIWSIAILVFVVLSNRIWGSATKSIKEEVAISIWLVFFFSGIFFLSGLSEAYRVRSGQLENYPTLSSSLPAMELDDRAFVLRSFSSGNLIVTAHAERLVFFNSASESLLEFPIDNEPFKGLFCLTLDWCKLSGWHYPSKSSNS